MPLPQSKDRGCRCKADLLAAGLIRVVVNSHSSSSTAQSRRKRITDLLVGMTGFRCTQTAYGSLVRSKAMRNVAATRKRRTGLSRKKDVISTVRRCQPSAMLAPLASTSYEIARSCFVQDITSLSILTYFGVSKAAVGAFASDPTVFFKLLDQSQR